MATQAHNPFTYQELDMLETVLNCELRRQQVADPYLKYVHQLMEEIKAKIIDLKEYEELMKEAY
jgi:hypothetical protein